MDFVGEVQLYLQNMIVGKVYVQFVCKMEGQLFTDLEVISKKLFVYPSLVNIAGEIRNVPNGLHSCIVCGVILGHHKPKN